jgi:hypothetical protein
LGSTNDGSPFVNADEDEDNLPPYKFERFDTPHPKPFAPKNRLSRNSGDFTQIINSQAESNVEVQAPESRQLRSVLKKRPVSTYSVNSQDEAQLISQINESRTKAIQMDRDASGFGWSIVGGKDSGYYKVCAFS